MKIRINRDIFLEVLQLSVGISQKASNDPITLNVLLVVDDNSNQPNLVIKATNYENSFSGWIPAEVEEAGNICVNNTRLLNLVREFNGDVIEIHSTPQNWVYLTSHNSKVKLPGVDYEQYPRIEFIESNQCFQLSGNALKKAIERTSFAVGDNETRKSLTGMNMEITSDGQILWTGADGFRIAQFRTKLPSEVDFGGNLVIPKKSLNDIKRSIEHSGDSIVVSFNEKTFQIVTDRIKYRTCLIEAEFPNLSGLIERSGRSLLIIKRRELTNAVKIMNTVTAGDANSVMKMSVGKDRVLLESQKMEFGEGNDEIECSYDGQEMVIGLNIRFFMELLQVFEGSEEDTINIMLTDPSAPLVVQCEDWKDFKTILMPAKIQW
jgi:DNA polymerase III subunit beta